MSLVVWLPMTKDLRQQGLSNVTVTNNGATFNSAGKLGGCYKTSSTATINLGYDGNQVNSGSLSFGGWFKFNKAELWSVMSSYNYTSTRTTPTGNLIGNNSYGGVSLQWYTNNIYNDSNLTTLYVRGCLRSTTNGARATSGVSLPFDTWVHIFFTFDKPSKVMTVWLNGEAKYTFTNLEFTDAVSRNLLVNYNAVAGGNGPGFSIPFLVNDVRIYDHCLSPMEVKRISQGLVLHYPLNSNSTYTSLVDKNSTYSPYNNFGTDVTYTLTTTGESYNGSSVRRLTATINNSSRVSSFKTDLWSHGVYGWRTTFKANTKYVFWIYYKPVTHTDIRVGGTASNIAGWTEISPEYVGNGWYRVGQYRNGTVTSDKTDSIFTSFTWASATTNTPISIDFACPTLIEGLTEIQPSINYNEGNIVYDTSGFCNNADIVGTWNTTNDTPKYNNSMHLSTTSSKIHILNFPTSGFGNSYSFAWWGKRDSNSPMFWGFSDGIRLNGMYAGTLWNTGDSSNNPIYKPGTTTTITAPSVNVWHHYVMTGDGTTCKLYLDGELYGQAKTYKAISGTSIYINGWDNGTQYCSNNTNMSDFRIYATALSADDVKSLYQNCATIDPDGTIRGKIR